MKKILTVCALGLFLVGGVVGCGGSPTSPSGAAPSKPAPTPTPAEKMKPEGDKK